MTELDIEKERREFEIALMKYPGQVWSTGNMQLAFDMWLLAKRAVLGSAEPVGYIDLDALTNDRLEKRWNTREFMGQTTPIFLSPPAPVSAEPVKTITGNFDGDSAALKATKDVMEIIAKPMQKGRESQRFHRIQCAISDAISAEKGKDQHYDDYAVDCFAAMMKQKLAKKRAQGYDNWYKPELCSVEYLKRLLHDHIVKGDPVDVANLCMMLRHYDASTTASAPQSKDANDSLEASRYRWLRDVSVPPHNFYLSVPEEFKHDTYRPEQVDSYIDAAIAAKEAGK